MSVQRVAPTPRVAAVGLVATLAVAAVAWDGAEARAPRHQARHHRVVHGPNYHPPYAAIVVDDNSGQVLHEQSAEEPRHPASLTKIMTLYLLFEQVEAGKLKLDTPLPISKQAALQHPTKLGLRAEQTIKVEDALLGLVTRSANDAAVVIAEAIGGSEAEFAKLMTQKAASLCMTGTTYVNASGLPAEEQITTARDQAILGRAIQRRFPGYYRYFSTLSFRYRGADIHNHNRLLGDVKGVDGIKTGYTDASGYNLVSSVRRDDRHIVAVVLGGTSNAMRDTRMRQLIEEHMVRAAAQQPVPMLMRTSAEAAECTDTIAATPDAPAPSITAAATLYAPATRSAGDGAPSAKRQSQDVKPVAATPKRLPRRERRMTSTQLAAPPVRAVATISATGPSRHLERRIGAGGSLP